MQRQHTDRGEPKLILVICLITTDYRVIASVILLKRVIT